MLTGTMTNRRSNAKSAYDLMSDIREYILEEPKRVWMGDWIITDMKDIELEFGITGPVCGTVGCIAGNTAVLMDATVSDGDFWQYAEGVLGGDSHVLQSGLSRLFLDIDVNADYGTSEYARIVAEHIKEFQSEHEQRLRAVVVTPPPTSEQKE